MSSPTAAARRPLTDERVTELYETHNARMIGYIQSYFGTTRELAEDACSYAWIQLLRYQPDGADVTGWLYTVARNQALTILKRNTRELPGCEVRESQAETLDTVVESRAALALIRHLKPPQQLVLLLKLDGHSYDEIAHITGRTHTWVTRHLTAARHAIRELRDL